MASVASMHWNTPACNTVDDIILSVEPHDSDEDRPVGEGARGSTTMQFLLANIVCIHVFADFVD